MHSENAVETITWSRFCRVSRQEISANRFALAIFLWVAVVIAVHLGRLQFDFRADFVGAQSGGGVS